MATGRERQRSVALADRLTSQQLEQLQRGEATHWLVVNYDCLELEPAYARMKLHMVVHYGSSGNFLEQASIRVTSTAESRPRIHFDTEVVFPHSGTVTPVLRLKLQREGVFRDWTIAKTAIHLPFRVGELGELDREVVFLSKSNSTRVGSLRVTAALQELRPGDSTSNEPILDTASSMMRRGWSSYSDFVTSFASERSSRANSKQTLDSKKSECMDQSFLMCEADTLSDLDAVSYMSSEQTRTPATCLSTLEAASFGEEFVGKASSEVGALALPEEAQEVSEDDVAT